MTGFGLYRIKREGDIVDPDDMQWEHNPHDGSCVECAARYSAWKKLFDEQESKYLPAAGTESASTTLPASTATKDETQS